MEHEILTGNDIYMVTSVLYPDGREDMPNSAHYINDFINQFPADKYEIAYILHDRDDAKKHIHLACRYKNGGTFSRSRYMDTLHVSYNNCWKVDNWQALIMYFLHRTGDSSDGKFQYPITSLYTNFDLSFINGKLMDNKKWNDEWEIVMDLCDYLNLNNGNWHKLMRYAGQKGCYRVLKNNAFLIDKQYKAIFHRYGAFGDM